MNKTRFLASICLLIIICLEIDRCYSDPYFRKYNPRFTRFPRRRPPFRRPQRDKWVIATSSEAARAKTESYLLSEDESSSTTPVSIWSKSWKVVENTMKPFVTIDVSPEINLP